jgi:hypothetical protein
MRALIAVLFAAAGVVIPALTAGATDLPASGRCLRNPVNGAFVQIFRQAVAEHCPCATDLPSKAAYRTCVSGILRQALADGVLPRECKFTAKRAALKSSCAQPGRATCCRDTGDGSPSCSLSRDCALFHRTVGATSSCYDACAGPPACDPAQLTPGVIDAKRDAAVAKWQAAGRQVDWTDELFRRWLVSQIPIELGCRLEPFAPSSVAALGTSSVQTAALTTSGTGTCGPAPEACMPPYDETGRTYYCSFGYGHWWDVKCGNDCLNRVCYRHDGCAGNLCVSGACQFAGNGDCDSCFFDGTEACARSSLQECSGADPFACEQAACIELIRSVARGVGTASYLAPGCTRNRTSCDDPLAGQCGIRCAGCQDHHSVCVPITDRNTPVRAVVGQSVNVSFCTVGCYDCGGCGAPGCNGYSAQSVTIQNCSGGQIGRCNRSFGQSAPICGGICGVTPECTEDVRWATVWQELDDCVATRYGVNNLGGPYADGAIIPLLP